MSKQVKLPTLLIVTDNPSIRFWVKKHLDDRFFVIGAENRQQAISALNARLDFILVDSELEGALELCKDLSKLSQKWHVPILLITGRLKKSFRDEATASGVTGFLSDQLDLEELEALISTATKTTSSREKTENLALAIKMPGQFSTNKSLKDKFVLNDQAVRALAAAKAEKLPMALLLMRIDDFDQMQNRQEILNHFSDFINGLLRDKDLLLPASEGGFILLLSNTKMDTARTVALRLQEKIQKQRFQIGAQVRHLTVSIVVSSLEASEKGFTKMLDGATKSLKAHSERNLIISMDDSELP